MPAERRESDAEKAFEALRERSRELSLEGRQMITGQWAPFWCSCSPWRDPADPAPAQHDCAVHGGFMITPDGTVL